MISEIATSGVALLAMTDIINNIKHGILFMKDYYKNTPQNPQKIHEPEYDTVIGRYIDDHAHGIYAIFLTWYFAQALALAFFSGAYTFNHAILSLIMPLCVYVAVERVECYLKRRTHNVVSRRG